MGFSLTNGKTVCRNKRCFPRSLTFIARPLRSVEAGAALCSTCGEALNEAIVMPWVSTIIGAKNG